MKSKLKKFLLGGASCATLLGGAALFLLSGGCSSTVDRDRLEEVAGSTTKDTLGTVYYKGRKGDYDYFKATWNVGAKNMKILIKESPVTKPFPYSGDKNDWRASRIMHLSGDGLKIELSKQF